MNEPKSFLARWSRRKHAAASDKTRPFTKETQSPAALAPANAEGTVENERSAGAVPQDCDGARASSIAAHSADPPFDPLSLPPIELIAADTDIRGFLAPGVPPELTRAALRRAWAADPKIRDFVGLADYDWDFNTPGSMAGFGSLEMTDDLRRAAFKIMGMGPSLGESDLEPDRIAQAEPVRHLVDDIELANSVPIPAPTSSGETDNWGRVDRESNSVQRAAQKPKNSQLVVRPGHGGALPK